MSESSQASVKKLKASVEILGNFVDQSDREDNRGGKGREWPEKQNLVRREVEQVEEIRREISR